MRPIPRASGTFCAGLIAMSVLWLVPATGRGQAELRFEELPDLDFTYQSIDSQRGQLRVLGEVSAAGLYEWARGAVGAPFYGSGAAIVLLGYSPSPTDLLRVQSQLVLPPGRLSANAWPAEPDDAVIPAAALSGRHRFQGRLGLGELTDGGLGVDVELAGRFDHGRADSAFVRSDLGQGQLAEADVRGTAWLRRGLAEVSALVLPVGYGVTSTWVEAAPGPGEVVHATTRSLHSGVGIRDYMRYVYNGWLEVVGLSLSRTDFQGPPEACPLSAGATEGSAARSVGTAALAGGAPLFCPGPLEQLDLRVLHFDDIVFRDVGVFGFGRETLFAFSGFVGGTWMAAGPGRTRQLGLLTFAASGSARFRFGTEGLARAHLGLGVSRRGDHTPTGDRLTALWRVEGHGALAVADIGMGAEVRSVLEWQVDAESSGEDIFPTAFQRAVESEWWLDLGVGLEGGAFHRARRGRLVSLDGWRRSQRWENEVGLFLRWRGGHAGEERYSSGPAGFSRW